MGCGLKSREIFKFIYDQLKEFKLRILVIIMTMIFITIIGVITPLFGQKLFDEGILNGDYQRVLHYIVLIAELFIGTIAFTRDH